MTAAMLHARNPYTGELDHRFEATSPAALDAMAARARQAQPAWAAATLDERVAVLREFAAAVAQHREALLQALVADTGRRRISQLEISGVQDAIERWAALAPAVLAPSEGRSSMLASVRFRSQQQPYALVGVVSPWNFPLSLSFIDAIPALLAGAAVIVKPSEITPRFVAPLREAIAAVPALRGVLQVAPGAGATGAALVERVDLVCFTGSVRTGKQVAAACARRFIPCFLELGGKDPAVVLEGSDIERAARAIFRAAVVNSGQACQSIERIYAHASLFEPLVAAFVALAQRTGINWPDPARGAIGPIISAAQAEVLRGQLADALAQGARVHCGGEIEDHGGLWLRPTVLTRVHHGMQVMRDETFGPLLPVMAFGSDEEAVALANDSSYGLSGCVFGPTDDAAAAVARRLRVGGISINDASLTSLVYEAEKHAFGDSGLGGSRMGAAGMRRFLRQQALLRNDGAPLGIEAFTEDAGDG